MAKTALSATRYADGSVSVVVHLDTTKLVGGQPDPAYMQQYDFGPRPAGFANQAAYETMIRAEIMALANADPRANTRSGASIAAIAGQSF